jgi:hypothetical protein
VTIEVDVKNIQYTEDEAELTVSCEVEASPPAQVTTQSPASPLIE